MNVLKELRNESGLTQTQFAEAIGTSQKNISRWELGETEPSVYYLKKIAEFFNISIDYVLGLEDEAGRIVYQTANSTVTPDERKIVKAYRALSPSGKQMILRMLGIE